MDSVVTSSALHFSVVEIIIVVLCTVLGLLIGFVLARRGSAMLRKHLRDMSEQQMALQGRLSQFAEDSASREASFRESLDTRLDSVRQQVGHSLLETQERNASSMKHLYERLALIDRAQKNIETLSGEVQGLQSLLSNKQARGAFGEKQMEALIENYLPPNAYDFQKTLSNKSRVDALIHLPNSEGSVAVDSKFPLESWRALNEDPNDQLAGRRFRGDVLRHIDDIASKYLIFGETHEIAMLFLPSEAVYAELHAKFPDVIEQGFRKKVMVVSPTTFMATLHTMRAVMKDAAMREQSHIIQKEVGLMAKDVTLLDNRVEALQRHFGQASEDVRKIRISTEKITKRADKIEQIDTPDSSNSTAQNDSLGQSGG